MLVLTGTELRRLVPMTDAIASMERAFTALAAGEVLQPQRLILENGSLLTMMARWRSDPGTVVKVVSLRPTNRLRSLPTIHAVAIWIGDSGRPEMLIEGNALTALRTGAASGLATDLLASPDAHVLAIIGSGGQAADQVRAVCAVRPIEEVLIYSPTRENCESLMARLQPELPGVSFSVAASVSDSVGGADVVCCATSAEEPLFQITDVALNAHVNAIGAHRPDLCELPGELLKQARVVAVDQREAALTEAGDIIQATEKRLLIADRLVELGALLADRPLTRPAGWTVFKSVGVAVQDLAVASLAVERASGLSTILEVPLWAEGSDGPPALGTDYPDRATKGSKGGVARA